MNAYQRKGRGAFYQRIRLRDGRDIVASCGTDDKVVAREVVGMLRQMKRRRDWAPLVAIVEKRTTLRAVFDAHLTGALPALLARLNDPDLDPLVSRWEAEGANAKYVKQVRAFIPKGQRFPASEFRKGRITAFLSGLKVQAPTKKRYRSALSVFGQWLVDLDVLESNYVRDSRRFQDNQPRTLWMSWEDAERVVTSAPQPYRAMFALLYGSGIEIGATLPLTKADIQRDEPLSTVRVRGTKAMHRNRVVRLEAWALPYVKALLQGVVGPAPLFPGINYDAAYHAHRRALKAVALASAGYTLHDARHTYAVNALKQGYDEQVVAHQLGHRDASLVRKVYGRFVPTGADYQKRHQVGQQPSRKASHE